MVGKIKSLSFCLLFFISASFADWTGSTREPENSKKIDGKIFYVITSAEELAWFAEQVNSGKSTINAVLANDIKFRDDTSKTSSVNWTPIGKTLSKPFNGVFDGAGHAIYSLYCYPENDGFHYAGMFGVCEKNAIVKDLKLVGAAVSICNRGSVGGLVGKNLGLVKNCVNVGFVKNNFSTSVNYRDSLFLGGIVGRNEGSVVDCRMVGDSVSSYTWSYSDITRSFFGGIVGWNSGTITGCTNSSTISYRYTYGYGGSSRVTQGGIVGGNSGSVANCINEGVIFFYYHASNISTGDSLFMRLAGVVGWNFGSVSGCVNRGVINLIFGNFPYDGTWAGGIVGRNEGMIAGCTNNGIISAKFIGHRSSFDFGGGIAGENVGTVTDCRNLGRVLGARYSGGVIGKDVKASKIFNSFSVTDRVGFGVVRSDSGTVTNCYYDSDVLPGLSTVAPNSGMHTSDMQSDRFAWVLNTTNGTAAHSGVWSRDSVGYPVFADSLHLPIYKVVFDDSGATTNRYTNYRGRVSFPENPEAPEGKMFSGWYTDDGVKVKATTVFSKDQTVHAVYIDASDIYFSIRFFDSDTTLLDSQSVQYGKTPSYAGTPTKASTAQYTYAFEGWHVEPTAATEDFDYYAVYSETLRSYTVRFLDFDGSELQSSTYLYGTTPGISKVPVRESTVAYDYAFSGWTPAIDTVKGPATYTALYDSSKVLYTVTFMDGSSVFATVSVPYGETAKAPGTPSREGYKFVGWNGSLSNVTGNVTVSALFEELVYREVVIDRGDDGMDTVKVEEDEWFSLPEAPEKPGHTFTGWYGPDGGFLGMAGDTVKVSADMRIEPRYEANLYKIAFMNGSDTLQGGKVAYGTLPSYTGTTPTKASSVKFTYAFKGWEPAIDTVKGPATYTAVFDSTKILYTVTFMDGDSVLAKVRVGYGETAIYPNATPIRSGYRFKGWSSTLSNVTGNMTVSALFIEIVYVNVIIDRGVGSLDTVSVEQNTNFTLPVVPEKIGHSFSGWFTPDWRYLGNVGEMFLVTEDIQIVAIFRVESYEIVFLNDGVVLQNKEFSYGALPEYIYAIPKRAASAEYTYTFVGWEPAIDTVTGPATYTAVFDSTEILQISSSSSSEASSSSGKSSSSVASSSSSAVSSSSSARENSSSSSEPSDAIMANLPSPAWSVTAAGRNFQIHAAPVGKSYALFDLQGKVLAKGRIESSEMIISAPRAGSYIVRIGNHSVRVNAK